MWTLISTGLRRLELRLRTGQKWEDLPVCLNLGIRSACQATAGEEAGQNAK